MRIIDAHKVQLKLFEESQNIRYFDKDRKKPQIFADGLDFAWVMLDNQPTVEAIPVEWFQKYIDRNNPEWNYDFCYVVLKILEDWEKENETE